MTTRKTLGLVIIAISLLFTGFQVFTAANGLMTALLQRSIHLSFVLALVFLFFPAIKDSKRTWLIDIPLVVAAISSGLYLYLSFDDLIYRIGDPNLIDMIIGGTTILVLLEATRRTVGWVMMWLAIISLLYSYFGQFLPEPFGHSGRDLERIVTQMFFSTEGIYGVPLGVAATYVFLFILFGSFMEKSGVGALFINLANAFAGKYQGGPARVGVISTAAVGMVSGSPVSDAATTGAFTIPLMKRVGYKAKTAAGIEAVAASGASLVPPVMGAGAFVMADMTGVPYSEIILYAVIPALLFYTALMFVVGNEARKHDMASLPADEIPGKRDALLKSLRLLIPLGILIFSLAVLRVSPLRAALYATGVILVTTILYNIFRPGLRVPMKNLFEALVETPRKVLVVSVACATAGIIIGMLGMTGLGLKLSDILMSASQGYLPIALLFAMVISIVLGMGLPPTAAYIVMAVTAAPFLVQMGVPVIVAHFFVFIYCCYAPITPPVALAAYTTAGIAGSNPFETGVEAFRLSLTGFVLPVMIVYNPALLGIGEWQEILITCILAVFAVWMMAVVLVGWYQEYVNVVWRIVLAAAALCCLIPVFWMNAAAVVVLITFVATKTNLLKRRNQVVGVY